MHIYQGRRTWYGRYGHGRVVFFSVLRMVTCQCGRGGIVQLRDGEALIQPYNLAAAPDSPPDLREEPGLGFQRVSMAVSVQFASYGPVYIHCSSAAHWRALRWWIIASSPGLPLLWEKIRERKAW